MLPLGSSVSYALLRLSISGVLPVSAHMFPPADMCGWKACRERLLPSGKSIFTHQTRKDYESLTISERCCTRAQSSFPPLPYQLLHGQNKMASVSLPKVSVFSVKYSPGHHNPMTTLHIIVYQQSLSHKPRIRMMGL
jgi:hypothetical protein